jgi:hypothetical protein
MTFVRTHEYQSDFARRHYAAGESQAVLAVLKARGVDVPPEARERIAACTDHDLLDTWIRRAATAHRIADVLAD